jgi:4-hydroxybenzoate polyprenyltransferase
MTLKQRLDLYEKLMRLDKPIGILLLLWPTLWALWFAARGVPDWKVLWIFVLGTVLMRSAGCVINDYADRDFDPFVARTQNRPLAARQVSTKEALLLAAVLALVSFLLILPLNRLTLWLSVPALAIAITYPYTKRFFAIPQAYLGIAFSFGIPMGFAAITGTVPPLAWLLLGANFLWTIAYDTEYAMVDRDDDLRIGIKTSAITFGPYDVLAVTLCCCLFLALMAAVGLWQKMGVVYYAGLALSAGLFVYHYRLIRDRNRERCFKAFLHNNWVGAAIFAGIAADYLLRRQG